MSLDTPRRAGVVQASLSVTRLSGVGVLGCGAPGGGATSERSVTRLATGFGSLGGPVPRAPWVLESSHLFCFPGIFSVCCSGFGLPLLQVRRYCEKSMISRKVAPLLGRASGPLSTALTGPCSLLPSGNSVPLSPLVSFSSLWGSFASVGGVPTCLVGAGWKPCARPVPQSLSLLLASFLPAALSFLPTARPRPALWLHRKV